MRTLSRARHRTALLGVPIEDATQHIGREAIGKGLRALPVVDAQESVVGQVKPIPAVVSWRASQLCPLQ